MVAGSPSASIRGAGGAGGKCLTQLLVPLSLELSLKKIVYIGEEIVSQIAEENTGSDEAATQKPGWVVPLLLPLSCPIII